MINFRNFCRHSVSQVWWIAFGAYFLRVKGFSFLFYLFHCEQGNRLGYPGGKRDFEQMSFPLCDVNPPIDSCGSSRTENLVGISTRNNLSLSQAHISKPDFQMLRASLKEDSLANM